MECWGCACAAGSGGGAGVVVARSIRVHFALRKSAITVLQPISKSSGLIITSRFYYTQRERSALTLPKLAVCPIKKVRDVPETAKNAMTYTRTIALRS